MSAAQHTPGPWRVDPDYTGDVQSADGATEIAISWTVKHSGCQHTNPANVPSDDVAIANARLIAAAPEMLAALVNLVEFCEEVFVKPNENDDLAFARAAIAKAEGR